MDRADIAVYVNGSPASFTWTSTGLVQLGTAPAAGVPVLITRQTRADTGAVTFSGGIPTPSLLNQAFRKVLYVAQEAFDYAKSCVGLGLDNQFDARGLNIRNVANPTQSSDATNLSYVQSLIATATAPLMALVNGVWVGRGARLTNIADPNDVQDAATPHWAFQNLLPKIGSFFEAGGLRIVDVADPVGNQDAATPHWAFQNLLPKVNGLFDAVGIRITNIADPVDVQDAATPNWAFRNLLPKVGNIFDAGGLGIHNLQDPVGGQDAATPHWAFQNFLAKAASNIFEAQGLRIENVADPVNNQDAATRGWTAASISNAVAQVVLAASNNAVAFVQAGAGAIARSFTDKMRDIVSVHDFGAVGDGVADDTAAFTAALTTGMRVRCRDGATYKLREIYVPANATGISGKATLNAAPTMSEGTAILNIYGNTSAFTVEDLTINALSSIASFTGTVTASSTTITGVSSFTGLVNGQLLSGARIPAGSTIVSMNPGAGTLVISQTPFDFPTGSITGTITAYHRWDAIGYGTSDGLTVRNCTVNGSHGIVGANSSRVNVHHNTVNGYLISGIESNSLSGAHSVIKQNDNVVFGDQFAYYGIVVNGGVDAQVNRNIIRGTAVHPVFMSGVSQPITTFQVMENIIHGSLNEGLFFCGNLSDGIISGNMETLYGSIDNGISIDSSGGYTISDLLVSNNHIESPGVVGIFIGEVNSPGSNVFRVLITGNKIVNPNSNRDDGFTNGIQIYGAGAQLITVVNNHITNYTGRMRYNVGEVAGTDGHPDANIIGPNTGAPGSLGAVNKLGTSTLVYATPLAP